MELHGTAALVTGGTGGIGAALVEALRTAGASVVAADLPGTGADLDLDVTDGEAVAAAITALDRLDLVVANAGIGVAGLVEDLDPDDWRRSVEVNICGAVNTVLPAYARLRGQRSGSIVLMSSLAGLAGTPLLTPYAMTKAALVGLGASLRPEAARHGVGVTTVCPGPVDTPLLDAPSATAGVDVRRYLTASAGAAISPAHLASLVVEAVRRDRPLVVPGRGGLLWRASRFTPRLTSREIARGMRKELRSGSGGT